MLSVKPSLKLIETDKSMLYDCVAAGFYGDDDLIKYYDKSVSVKTEENMVLNAVDKLKEHIDMFDETKLYSAVIDNKCIGFAFVINNPNHLVSFAISSKYRNKNILIDFFNEIKKEMNNKFSCLLHSTNTRAINWLEKCGMSIHDKDDLITILKH